MSLIYILKWKKDKTSLIEFTNSNGVGEVGIFGYVYDGVEGACTLVTRAWSVSPGKTIVSSFTFADCLVRVIYWWCLGDDPTPWQSYEMMMTLFCITSCTWNFLWFWTLWHESQGDRQIITLEGSNQALGEMVTKSFYIINEQNLMHFERVCKVKWFRVKTMQCKNL